jgi:predicted Zn-dependent peptidase
MYKKTIYPNGLRLITIPNPATKAVTVFVFCGVGSRYETEDINGVSHFIEHIMFKGTKKRPTTLDISRDLDSVGAEFNAMTAKDWTGYFIKIDSQKVELAIDMLADMLNNSKFAADDIDRERGVIVEEINMYRDNPMMYIEDLLEQAVFRGSTLGWEIAGPRKVIRSVPVQKILKFKNTYYVPDNMIIAVAGNLAPQTISRLVKKHFRTEAQKPQLPKLQKTWPFKPFVRHQTKPQILIRERKTEQVQLALGFPGFSYFEDEVYALALLSVILGENMSSRLFMAVREKRGLAYAVKTFLNVYQDTGVLIIQAGLDKSRIQEAIKVICDELRRIKRQGVTKEELKKANAYLRGKIILQLEDSSQLAEWFARQELMENQMMTPEQKLKRLSQVTLADLKEVANQIFKKKLINLAVIGPYEDKKYFEEMFVL